MRMQEATTKTRGRCPGPLHPLEDGVPVELSWRTHERRAGRNEEVLPSLSPPKDRHAHVTVKGPPAEPAGAEGPRSADSDARRLDIRPGRRTRAERTKEVPRGR